MRKAAYDVAVVGGGVAGLATLAALAARGVKRLALAHAGDSASAATPGWLIGGQVDNFTRLSHGHGAAVGTALWRFGDQAFDAVASFCQECRVPLVRTRRVRLVASPPELQEVGKAVAELGAAGFKSVRLVPARDWTGPGLTARILAVQDEGDRGACVDGTAYLAALAAATAAVPRFPAVTVLASGPDGVRLALEGGKELTSEVVVVAAHLGTGALVPALKDALVPYADQWSEYALPGGGAKEWTGVAFSVNHSYEWGVVAAPDRVRLGGGRYLRPLAGIEAPAASAEDKITQHLAQQLGKTFAFGAGAKALATHAARDIRPCDELPVVGPMYGDPRVLVATGFSGQGLTLGFHAGQCLAELIVKGTCDALPRLLWPERLRTLSS